MEEQGWKCTLTTWTTLVAIVPAGVDVRVCVVGHRYLNSGSALKFDCRFGDSA